MPDIKGTLATITIAKRMDGGEGKRPVVEAVDSYVFAVQGASSDGRKRRKHAKGVKLKSANFRSHAPAFNC